MQNIQDKQFKEAAKAAYSKASQAVQQMKVDNGGTLANYRVTTNYWAFYPELRNILRWQKIAEKYELRGWNCHIKCIFFA